MRTQVVVKHADLPSYGLKWHKEPMSIWSEWLDPYLGQLLSTRELRLTVPPAEWCEGEQPRDDDSGEELGRGGDHVAEAAAGAAGAAAGSSGTAGASAADAAAAGAALREIAERPSCMLLH